MHETGVMHTSHRRMPARRRPLGRVARAGAVPQPHQQLLLHVRCGVLEALAPAHLRVQFLHTMVELLGEVRGLGQAGDEAGRHLPLVLVIDLVLQAGPEVHGDRPDLNLHGHGDRARAEEHRNLDERVQALVPVGLRGGDVVLDLEYPHIVLRDERLQDLVGVGDEAARDPHSGDVQDAGPDRLRRGGDVEACHFPQDAPGGLDPGADVLDRVVPVQVQEFPAQDRHLGQHLVDGERVLHLDALEVLAHPARERNVLGRARPPARSLRRMVGHEGCSSPGHQADRRRRAGK